MLIVRISSPRDKLSTVRPSPRTTAAYRLTRASVLRFAVADGRRCRRRPSPVVAAAAAAAQRAFTFFFLLFFVSLCSLSGSPDFVDTVVRATIARARPHLSVLAVVAVAVVWKCPGKSFDFPRQPTVFPILQRQFAIADNRPVATLQVNQFR